MHTKAKTLTPELLRQIDAYWRAANYLSVGQIYLYDNPLVTEPYTRNLWCSWQSVQPMAAAKRWVMPILRLSAPGGPSPRRPA